MNTKEFLCKPGTYYVRCLIFDAQGNSKEFLSNPVTTNGKSVSFDYEGKPRKVSLLEGKYKLEVWGAKGGDSTGERYGSSSSIVKGGLGGYSRGILRLNENQTVHVYVGGEGKTGDQNDGSITEGGFPDGDDTKTGHCRGCDTVPGTGGCSTSIRIGIDNNYSRVIVAGGGGGASGGNCYHFDELIDQGSGTQTSSSCGIGYDLDGDPGRFGHGGM